MGLLDVALAPLRAVLGSAERDAEHLMPVHEIEHIQEQVLDTAQAIRHATESIESHVAVLESLATSIDPLAEAIVQLTAQLVHLNRVLAPLAGAEHVAASAERDLSRLEHLFGRRHRNEPAASLPPDRGAPPSSLPPDRGAPPSSLPPDPPAA